MTSNPLSLQSILSLRILLLMGNIGGNFFIKDLISVGLASCIIVKEDAHSSV